MGKNDITALSEKIGLSSGASPVGSGDAKGSRIIYPAIVRDVGDKASQNRLKAEIVSIDENGEIKGGKDGNTPLEKLPICIPLMSEFLHVRPVIGELVLLIIENPSDMTSPRYWVGPMRTSQTKMDFEGYTEAYNVFNRSSFNQQEIFNNPTAENNPSVSTVIPRPAEISMQGRHDANITFKKREVIIRTGEFEKDSLDINSTHPCKIQLKQFDESSEQIGVLSKFIKTSTFIPYSQTNIIATNINLISTEGSNRNPEGKTIESTTNKKDLERFGNTAKQLHPIVFGDELVKLLKIMINFMLNHFHTPQNPAVAPVQQISQLGDYKSDTKMQELISKFVRAN